MIKYLKLTNFVLFQNETIIFQNKINALVGSTGAGKSIIFAAINVLSGQRNIKKYIMKNKDYYELEMQIDITNVTEQNKTKIKQIINIENKSFITVYRKLNIQSKSIIKIDDQEISLMDLKKVMENLVEIHFQNTTEEALKLENQINIIDDIVDSQLLESYSIVYKEYLSQKSKVIKLNAVDQNKEETLELLEFQIQKLETIKNLESEEELEEQKKNLENIEKTQKIDREVTGYLDGIYSNLGTLKNIIESNKDLGYDKYIEIVNNVYYEVENLNFEHSKKELSTEPQKLDTITDSLSNLRNLKRKYNLDYEGLVNKYQELIDKQDSINNLEDTIIKEEQKLKAIKDKLSTLANELSQKRQEISDKIQKEVNKNFQDLKMPNAYMHINISQQNINEKGVDNVQILIRTNKGHDMQNIMEIASGGEKSRIMLIFKMVINKFKNKKIFLLDEIDQGVSAEVAKSVGLKLKDFAENLQVIIISHTVQVINLADHLYEVEKDDHSPLSISHIYKLEGDEKTEYINKYLEI